MEISAKELNLEVTKTNRHIQVCTQYHDKENKKLGQEHLSLLETNIRNLSEHIKVMEEINTLLKKQIICLNSGNDVLFLTLNDVVTNLVLQLEKDMNINNINNN